MATANYSETLFDLMEAAFKTISVDDGYFFNVSNVSRFGRQVPTGTMPAIRIRKIREVWAESGSSWLVTALVRVDGYAPFVPDQPSDIALTRLEADIKRALVTQIHDGHHAILSGVVSEPFEEADAEEATEGIGLDVTWTYRVDIQTPTQPTAGLL